MIACAYHGKQKLARGEGSLISPPPLPLSFVIVSDASLPCAFRHPVRSTFMGAPLSTLCPSDDIFCWIVHSPFFPTRGVPLRGCQPDPVGPNMPAPPAQGREPARQTSPRRLRSHGRPFRLCPARPGSRVVPGAPRSCQNVRDITHIINNYRLFTDGRADGHTATEICLISARRFPPHFPRPALAASPEKEINEKTQNVYERKMKICWPVYFFIYFCVPSPPTPAPRRRKRPGSPPRRGVAWEPCPPRPRAAAGLVCTGRGTKVRADPVQVPGHLRRQAGCSQGLAVGGALATRATCGPVTLIGFRGDQPHVFKTCGPLARPKLSSARARRRPSTRGGVGRAAHQLTLQTARGRTFWATERSGLRHGGLLWL